MHSFLTLKEETCSFGTIWACFMLEMGSLIHRAIGDIWCEFGCITTSSAGLFLSKSGQLGTGPSKMTVDSKAGRWSPLLTGLTLAHNNVSPGMVEVGWQTDLGWAFLSRLTKVDGSGYKLLSICAFESKVWRGSVFHETRWRCRK